MSKVYSRNIAINEEMRRRKEGSITVSDTNPNIKTDNAQWFELHQITSLTEADPKRYLSVETMAAVREALEWHSIGQRGPAAERSRRALALLDGSDVP